MLDSAAPPSSRRNTPAFSSAPVYLERLGDDPVHDRVHRLFAIIPQMSLIGLELRDNTLRNASLETESVKRVALDHPAQLVAHYLLLVPEPFQSASLSGGVIPPLDVDISGVW